MARIYQTAHMGEANILAARVSERGMADLLVYRVSSWGLAHGDAYWYITRNRQDATVCVFFTSPGMAQIKIFFVDTFGEAGWKNNHLYMGKLTH